MLFYESLGFPALPSLPGDSMLTWPSGGNALCSEEALSLAPGDFRLQMCADVKEDDFFAMYRNLVSSMG